MPAKPRKFLRGMISPEPKRIINRERAILLLVIAFVITSIYIHGFDHGVGTGEPHLKDEEGYYGWAELYTEGYYSIPLDEVRGTLHYETTFSTDVQTGQFDLDHAMGSFDDTGQNNDIRITLRYANGTAVPNANVSIDLKAQTSTDILINTTDSSGVCILYNIPLGKVPIVATIPQEEEGLPIILHETVESTSKGGRYNIYAEAQITRITDNFLVPNLNVETVDNGPLTPVADAEIYIDGNYAATTDAAGNALLPDDRMQHARIGVKFDHDVSGRVRLSLGDQVRFLNDKGVAFFGVTNNYLISVLVEDIFGKPVEDVEIMVDPGQGGTVSTEMTDGNGELELELELESGEHVLVAHKLVDGYEPPLASGIAEVDGEYQYVNHWPPGPSVVISWLINIGAEGMFGTLMILLLCFSTWGVARRIFGWKVAALATFFSMTNGITLQLYFGQWMGDLSSTAFAFGGLWLFLVSMDLWKKGRSEPGTKGEDVGSEDDEAIDWESEGNQGNDRKSPRSRKEFTVRWFFPVLAALVSGLFFGACVTMRYSTIVACAMPFIYLLGYSIKESIRGKRNWKTAIRNFFSRRTVVIWLALLIPLVIGMAIIGALLMSYNDHYFGGPLNSGYQSSHMLVVDSDTSGNQSLEAHEPPNTFFDAYFRWGDDDKENAPYIFQYMLIFVPILYLALPALYVLRKEPMMYSLFSWVVLTFIIYLSQGWVLKRTIEDIRYYSPLIPPCAILAGSLLVSLGRAGKKILPHGKNMNRAVVGIIAVVVLLLLVATVTAGNYTIEDKVNPRKFGPPQGGKDQSMDIPRVPIPSLLDTPGEFEDKEVTVIHAEVDRIMNQENHLYMLRDDKTLEEKILMNVQEPVESLKPGTALEVTGVLLPDKKKPGNWLLVVEGEKDIRIMTRANTGEVNPTNEFISGVQGTRGSEITRNQFPSFNDLQIPQGNNNKQQPRPQKSNERSPLADELITARTLSVSGLAIFYVLGAYVWVKRKENRR